MKETRKRNSVVTRVHVPLVVTLGIVIAPSELAAQESKSYTEVKQAVFDSCIKPKEANKTSEGWAEYDAGNKGEVRIKAHVLIVGITEVVKLGFNYEPDEKKLTYTIKWKMVGATERRMWEGFDATMKKSKVTN